MFFVHASQNPTFGTPISGYGSSGRPGFFLLLNTSKSWLPWCQFANPQPPEADVEICPHCWQNQGLGCTCKLTARYRLESLGAASAPQKINTYKKNRTQNLLFDPRAGSAGLLPRGHNEDWPPRAEQMRGTVFLVNSGHKTWGTKSWADCID